jgi:uncharacterized protein YdeI (YjbR/CyaY-like superfamily)
VQLSKTLYAKDREAWRAWLERNHQQAAEIWLIYYKKHTRQPSIAYADAVEEALCFGWIDGIVKRDDDERYAQRFTLRRARSKWSELNRQRARRLIAEGRMTSAGEAVLPVDLMVGVGEQPSRRSRSAWADAVPDDLVEAFEENRAAREYFERLAPSYRRQYVGWIASAKREETRRKRLREAIALLAQERKLGMK